jgi:hypothetical protein
MKLLNNNVIAFYLFGYGTTIKVNNAIPTARDNSNGRGHCKLCYLSGSLYHNFRNNFNHNPGSTTLHRNQGKPGSLCVILCKVKINLPIKS